MLFKLALRNVKRQISNYLIYFITVTLTVALIFSLNNMIFSDLMSQLQKHDLELGDLKPLLFGFSGLLTAVVALAISYVTSFLLRRRKKEFGLYLTLGMTRGNILSIFAGETAVTFALSLGFGMFLGLGLYQALMAIFINFLEMEYTLSAYSVTAVIITVAMSAGMFLLASVVSLIYLRFVKISRLLHGERTAEKTVKYPIIWLIVALCALGLLIGSIVWLADWLYDDYFDSRLSEIVYFAIMMSVGAILLPAAVSKSIVPLCVKRKEKTLSAKGTAVFTMRQLSGRLNANSVIAGILTFLLLVSIIASNVALAQSNYYKAEVNNWLPFDVRFYDLYGEQPYSYESELKIVEQYADVDEVCVYRVYEFEHMNTPTFWGNVNLIKESDYNKLCSMLGEKPIKLNGGFRVFYNEEFIRRGSSLNFSELEVSLGGVSYSYEGSGECIDNKLLFDYGDEINIVVPDGAADPQEFESCHNLAAVKLKNTRFDSRALTDALRDFRNTDEEANSEHLTICHIKRFEWLSEVGNISIYFLICMFIAVTFILLSMALLALKMLTMIDEDKRYYKILWRLGAGKSMIFKSLFSQMFFFYFLPFALPLIGSGVMIPFLIEMLAKHLVAYISNVSVFLQVFAFIGVMLILYALYFTVTYLIARRDIKKTLQSVG